MPVCEFPIAVHHRHRLNDEVKEEVCYIDIVAFGKIDEHSKNFLHKGAHLLVDGRLSQGVGKLPRENRETSTKWS
jgi:single-strand DNA-binding protein